MSLTLEFLHTLTGDIRQTIDDTYRHFGMLESDINSMIRYIHDPNLQSALMKVRDTITNTVNNSLTSIYGTFILRSLKGSK